MAGVPPPYVLTLVVAGLVSLALATVGYRHRDVDGGVAFTVMMAAGGIWALGDAVQLTAGGWGGFLLWTAVSFAASTVVLTAAFVFVVAYTGRDHWLTERTLALLAVEPTAVVALVSTNWLHGLMWWYTGPLRTDPVTWAPVETDLLFQLHLLYSYALVGALVWLLGRFYLRSRGTYRWQTLLMLLGVLVPGVTNVFWLVVQTGYPDGVDPTPVTFVITGMLFTVGLRSFDLLELAPVGRHTVVEELSDAVLTVDDTGTVVDANPVSREVIAPSGLPLIGAPAADVIPGYEAVVDDGGPIDVTRTVDGDQRVFEVRESPLTDATGADVGRVLTLSDVTERRERERRLQQRNDQLEEFASVISHDLRGPLSVAHGYGQMLDEDLEDERLGKVVAAHERMEELIEDLLTLAREGRRVSEPEPVDLAEAAHQAWGIVDTGRATLTVETDRTVMADDTRLRQLLENLFTNAAEHGRATTAATADGGSAPALTVTVGATERGFYVADDGPGIPPKERGTVFEAGESGDEDGVGLGLTIVRRIADAHGWTAAVEESEAGGARFTFQGVDWVE